MGLQNFISRENVYELYPSLVRQLSVNQPFFSIYYKQARPSGESLRNMWPSCGLKMVTPCCSEGKKKGGIISQKRGF
jgi:hypothetical protein